ncbi:MAG: glycosyltransferase, partial [Deltaproteobacteria bacterium]|nr:glycosyltransferase [Deltaproteobacteria bacterium]
TAGLSDYKLATKLVGLACNERVVEVLAVRQRPLADLPRVRNVNPGGLWGATRPAYEVWRFFALRRLVRETAPTAIVGIQLTLHGVQAALAAGRSPAVLSVIGTDVQVQLRCPWSRPLLRWALNKASAVTVLGPVSGRLVREAGVPPENVFEVQNYQEERRFRPEPSEVRWDVVYVGALSRLKRVDALVQAIHELWQDGVRARLCVLGEGPERARLEELATRLGVADSVEFLGHRADVENYLHRSRVFAMASESEALPAAAVEAMFCGLPVVLTDVGDVRAVFSEENAMIVPARDSAALVRALRCLLSDSGAESALRKGALEARDLYARRWSQAAQAKRWDEILAWACRGWSRGDR